MWVCNAKGLCVCVVWLCEMVSVQEGLEPLFSVLLEGKETPGWKVLV